MLSLFGTLDWMGLATWRREEQSGRKQEKHKRQGLKRETGKET
jgi:hypothetical protein